MSGNNVSQTLHNFIRSLVPGQEPHDSPQLPQPEVPANDAVIDAAPQPLTVQNVESMDVDVPPSSSQDDDNDSMPPLNDISESEESDEDFSQSDTSMDADELEVQLQAISDGQVSESSLQPPPPPTTTSNTPAASPSRSSTRRARVETDEDQDRDRRHPSQRVHVDNTTPVAANGPQPAQPLPRIHLPFRSGPGLPPGAAANPDTFRFWQHFMQGIPGPPDASNVAGGPPNNAQAPPAGQPQNGHTGHPMMGLLGITIDLSADPHIHAHPPPNPTPGQPPHQHQHMPPPMFNPPTGFVNVGDGTAFTELLARFGGMMGGLEYEQEDPERAKRLINGLEEVPIGLVRRLERVGAVGGSDDNAVGGSGGDSCCAICWDRLLDGDGNQFGKEEESNKGDASSSDTTQSLPETSPATSSSTAEETLMHDDSSESKTSASLSTQPSHPKIVALPCAHVFHASCLIPWFSRPRQTTCPTCRFNVDPENLTYVRRRRTPRPAPAPANAPTAPAATGNEGTAPSVDANADTPTTNNTPATDPVPPPPVNAGAGPAAGIGGHGLNIPRNSIFTQALFNTLMGVQPTAAAGAGTGPTPTAPSETIPDQPGAPNPNASTDAPRNGGPLPQISAADLVNIFMSGHTRASGTNPPAQGPAPPNPTPVVATSQGATPSSDNDLPPLEPIDAPLPDAAAQPAPAPGQQQGVPLNNDQRSDGQDQGFVTIGFDMIFGPAPGEGGADEVVMGELPNNIDLHGEFGLAGTFEDQFDQAMHGIPVPPPPDNHGPQPAPNPPQQNNAPSIQSETHIHIHRPGHGPDGGMHFAAGSGRTIAEALAQLHRHAQAQPAGGQPEQANQQQQPQLPPLFPFMSQRFRGAATGAPAGPSAEAGATPPPPPQATATGAHGNAGTGLPHFAQFLQGAGLPMGAMGTMGTVPPFIIGGGTGPHHQPRQPTERKKWTLPPAPGPTLRQRIERKEREAGLRCYDMSCGVGPSDEDPFVAVSEEQVHIQRHDTETGQVSVVCEHTFHPSCLVSAQRVALRGADENVEGEDVEEGVRALA
ncbi:uncharacterized protein EV420DRAFT_456015 [Desarmillaria tabescens]|uniref:RING-type domain-containing protein n=1 Tax=Armillaria tabescens TaxID=1929756 RepID=A0AA39NMH4_ARMTA|nr:uncharacterized protein EV420DRAFT_456015 [Desarmillaria tabescens]KAK0468290.1 hypothetical protein EV420DRAFT_456015 [Desarmillaria tabescens]